MKKLTDFANIAQLQTYIKDWNSLTGLSAAITDLDGNCLTTRFRNPAVLTMQKIP